MGYFFQEWIDPINLLEEHNLTFPPHLHDTVELIYIAEGSVGLNIVTQDYTLYTGDFAAVFPGQLHRFHDIGSANKIRMIIFHISQIPQFAHELEHCHPENPVIRRDSLHPDILMAFQRLFSLGSEADLRIRQAWIHLILSNLFSVFSLQKNTSAGDTWLVVRILDYLSSHFTEPLTLEALAQELHVNKYYLSHTFSNKLYLSFTACVNRLRIEKARELLKTTNYSIETIGEMVGYETQRTFNRVFKKMVGFTPREYRRNQSTEINRSYCSLRDQ